VGGRVREVGGRRRGRRPAGRSGPAFRAWLPYMQVFGALFNNNGAFLREVELSPPVFYSIEEVDVVPPRRWVLVTWRKDGEKLRARRVAAGGPPSRVLVAGQTQPQHPWRPRRTTDSLVCWATYNSVLVRLHGADAQPRGGPILIARGAIGGLSLQPRLQLAVNAAGLGVVAWWSQFGAGRQPSPLPDPIHGVIAVNARPNLEVGAGRK